MIEAAPRSSSDPRPHPERIPHPPPSLPPFPLPPSPHPSMMQLTHAAATRLSDLDPKVRAAAAALLCAVETSPHPRVGRCLVSMGQLQEVAARMRDKKLAVRCEAASGLLAVFRAWAAAVAAGGFSDHRDPRATWIPGKVAHAAVQDPELRRHVMDLMGHHEGFLPVGLTDKAAASIWALTFSQSDEFSRSSLKLLLRQKAVAGQVLVAWLDARQACRRSSPEDEEAERRAQAVLSHCSRMVVGRCPGLSPKAAELMHRLSQDVKDMTVLDRLAVLLDPTTATLVGGRRRRPTNACHPPSPPALKDCLSRLPGGSRTALADFVASAARLAQPNILTVAHLRALLELMSEGGATVPDASQAPKAGADWKPQGYRLTDLSAADAVTFGGAQTPPPHPETKAASGLLQLASSYAPQLTAHVLGDAAQLLLEIPALRPIPDTLLQEGPHPHSQAAAAAAAAAAAVGAVACTGVMVATLVGLLGGSAQAWGALSQQRRPQLPGQGRSRTLSRHERRPALETCMDAQPVARDRPPVVLERGAAPNQTARLRTGPTFGLCPASNRQRRTSLKHPGLQTSDRNAPADTLQEEGPVLCVPCHSELQLLHKVCTRPHPRMPVMLP
ncbi:MAG: hypothetical protein WDW38_004101 [Sanguina aurantia]